MTTGRRSMTRALLAGTGVILFVGTMAIPARADDDYWRGRERREHARHERYERQEWCNYHPYECGNSNLGGFYVAPPPPAVVYPAPPPPIGYAPSPGLEIVVPFHIR